MKADGGIAYGDEQRGWGMNDNGPVIINCDKLHCCAYLDWTVLPASTRRVAPEERSEFQE
jgi:hypothetical protein